MLGVLGLSGL